MILDTILPYAPEVGRRSWHRVGAVVVAQLAEWSGWLEPIWWVVG